MRYLSIGTGLSGGSEVLQGLLLSYRRCVHGLAVSAITLAELVTGFAGQRIPRRASRSWCGFFGLFQHLRLRMKSRTGIWEVLAGIALLAPRVPRLKEWAYAGIFFNMTGAAASRAVRGDDVSHIVAPLVFACLAEASWALRPQSRSLGVLSPAEKRA